MIATITNTQIGFDNVYQVYLDNVFVSNFQTVNSLLDFLNELHAIEDWQTDYESTKALEV